MRNTTRAVETGGGPAVTIHVSWNARQGEPLRRHNRHQDTVTGTRRIRVPTRCCCVTSTVVTRPPSFARFSRPFSTRCVHSVFTRCRRYHHYHNRGVGTSAVEKHNVLPPPQSVARSCTRRRKRQPFIILFHAHEKLLRIPDARASFAFLSLLLLLYFFSAKYGYWNFILLINL